MNGHLGRRSLLRVGGATALSSLAGCAAIEAKLGVRTQRLGRVVLANSVDEPFEVRVEVLRDGTTVLDATYRLAPGSTEERPQEVLYDWEENPDAERWVVRAKVPSSEWRDAVLRAAVGRDGECHSVRVVTGDWPETPLLVVPGGCGSTPPAQASSK